ncbi:MAG: 2-amino-4-hydroxy-6-hydroxymethyldihydropteridine diphosphokinase [Syntrophobacteraceae bacterium]
MEEVLIGFGSNQGDSVAVCKAAIRALSENAVIRLIRVSSFYRTTPVGYLDQEWFVNGVMLCSTTLSPSELLGVLHAVEQSFGRKRTLRWGPRTLDLDLLAHGDRVLHLPDLTVPHARMHERRFVLAPLVEIYPEWIHPVLGKSARELLSELSDGSGQDVLPMVLP